MPRLPLRLLHLTRTPLHEHVNVQRPPHLRRFHTNHTALSKNQDSTPGWQGRQATQHAVNRSPHDPQAEAAQRGMGEHAAMKEGSDAISRRDERDSNKRAKEEHPEAPEPVIGMNEERGSLSNATSPFNLVVNGRHG